MDLVLNVADHYVLTPYVYPLSWPEDTALRQIISLLVVTNLGITVLYLGVGWLSYQLIFDHNLMKHPLFLKVCPSLLYSILVAWSQILLNVTTPVGLGKRTQKDLGPGHNIVVCS